MPEELQVTFFQVLKVLMLFFFRDRFLGQICDMLICQAAYASLSCTHTYVNAVLVAVCTYCTCSYLQSLLTYTHGRKEVKKEGKRQLAFSGALIPSLASFLPLQSV